MEDLTMRLPSPALVLLMLLTAAPATSAPPAPAPQAQTLPASAPAATRAAVDGRQKSSAPAATFTPSEKIKADSAVSFPVDI
jgi:hypothetical protein